MRTFRWVFLVLSLVLTSLTYAQTPTIEWIDSSFTGAVSSGLSLLGNKYLYGAVTSSRLYRIDAATGQIQAATQAPGTILNAVAVSYDTTAYLSSNTTVNAYDNDAIPLWASPALGGTVVSSPTIDSVANAVYVGLDNGNIFALNRTSGQILWHYSAGDTIIGSGVITADRKLVYLTTDGRLVAFNLNTPRSGAATPDWNLKISGTFGAAAYVPITTPVTDDSGYVYYLSDTLDQHRGSQEIYNTVLWKVKMPDNSPAFVVASTSAYDVTSLLVGTDGTIYGIGPNEIRAFTPDLVLESRHPFWKDLAVVGSAKGTGAPYPIVQSLISSDGTRLYCAYDMFSYQGSPHGGIAQPINLGGDTAQVLCYALGDTGTVSLLWRTLTPFGVSGPIVYQNNTLYISTLTNPSTNPPYSEIIALNDAAIVNSGSRLYKTDAVSGPPMWGNQQGNSARTGVYSGKSSLTAVKRVINHSPSTFKLSQNYPNPFNPTTQIAYSLPRSGMVTIAVYNALGQRVSTLFSGRASAGEHVAMFNADRFASGVYFCRMEAEGFSHTVKMMLLK